MKESKHSQMTFQELWIVLDQFDIERKWTDLDPSDLAKSIMLEWAELLEYFQRDNTLVNRGEEIPNKSIDEISYEVADIMIYLMKFCREMNIDIVDALSKKLEKIAKKYPPDYKDKGGYDEYLRIKKEYRKNN